jgi:hypothetical protein
LRRDAGAAKGDGFALRQGFAGDLYLSVAAKKKTDTVRGVGPGIGELPGMIIERGFYGSAIAGKIKIIRRIRESVEV